MNKKNICIGIIAVILLFGVSGVGYADEMLNGTWVYRSVEMRQMPVSEMRQHFINSIKNFNS